MTRWLFVFRQDLRTKDNTWLYNAAKNCKELLPVFIIDETIINDFPDKDPRLGFQQAALVKLKTELEALWSTLHVYTWQSVKILSKLCKEYSIDEVFRNKSYGQNAQSRDIAFKKRADENGITCRQYSDYLLVEPKKVVQMKVFTPFYKRRMWKEKRRELYTISTLPAVPENNSSLQQTSLEVTSHPHRDVYEWDRIIENLRIENYDELRNFPWTHWTSKLSPYLAFWLVSPRQILRQAINEKTPWVSITDDKKTVTMDKKVFVSSFVSELARREYRQHVQAYFPETWTIEFQEKRRGMLWNTNQERLQARKDGNTWYPIVDAAMRQLKEENRMHGRCRMIVASFLTKDLLIDRRLWEEHFKDYLIDYDKNVNIWNRQRSASVWPDPKPLRIFNPILQSQRFDKECTYIKKWLPELEGEPLAAIHDPIKYDLRYTRPIVDHYVTSKIAKKMYYKEPYEL